MAEHFDQCIWAGIVQALIDGYAKKPNKPIDLRRRGLGSILVGLNQLIRRDKFKMFKSTVLSRPAGRCGPVCSGTSPP